MTDFVLEYLSGGELFEQIRQVGSSGAAFIGMMQICLCLEKEAIVPVESILCR